MQSRDGWWDSVLRRFASLAQGFCARGGVRVAYTRFESDDVRSSRFEKRFRTELGRTIIIASPDLAVKRGKNDRRNFHVPAATTVSGGIGHDYSKTVSPSSPAATTGGVSAFRLDVTTLRALIAATMLQRYRKRSSESKRSSRRRVKTKTNDPCAVTRATCVPTTRVLDRSERRCLRVDNDWTQ